MTTEDAYKLYLALRLHFTRDDYDITKTLGKVKWSPETLEKNPKLKRALDKYRRRYPTRQQFIDLLVANFIAGDRHGGMFADDPETPYHETIGRVQRLTYLVTNELRAVQSNELIANVTDLWSPIGTIPKVQPLHYAGKLSMQTLTALNKLFPYTATVSAHYTNDPVWTDLARRIEKYAVFLRFDTHQMTKTIHTIFHNA